MKVFKAWNTKPKPQHYRQKQNTRVMPRYKGTVNRKPAPKPAPNQGVPVAPSPIASEDRGPTPLPTGALDVVIPDCFSNTTELFDSMYATTTEQEEEAVGGGRSYVYTLCPHTVYNIGFLDANGVCCEDGMDAIVVKSRTRIRCGESGSLDNNCTLLGGQIQLVSGPSFFGEDEAVEAVFEGITFEAAEDTGLLLAQRGDVTFCRLCIQSMYGVRLSVCYWSIVVVWTSFSCF